MIMMMMIKIMILFSDADDDDNAFNNILVTAVFYEVRCYTTQALVTIIVSYHRWHRFCFKTKIKPPVLNSSHNLILKFVLNSINDFTAPKTFCLSCVWKNSE